MRRDTLTRAYGLLAIGATLVGCSSLLGDFSVEASDGSTSEATPGDEGGTQESSIVEGSTGDGMQDVRSPPGDTGPVQDAPSCPAGQTYCGGGCVSTATSSADCGGCGNDCGGATCSAGKCSALTITSNLATAPYGVAAGGGQVFWARSGAVEKCPAAGCSPSPQSVSNDSTLTNQGLVGGTTMATDGNYVVWLAADPNSSSPGYPGPVLYTCHASGCFGAPQLGSATTAMSQLFLEGTSIYANLGCGGGSVKTCALGACTGDPLTTTVASAGVDCGYGIVSDGTTLFFSAGGDPIAGGAIACPVAGCPTTGRVQLFQDANLLAQSGDTVYATTGMSSVVSCKKAGCGGSPTVLAASQTPISSMVADASHLYYAVVGSSSSATGEIRVCALPGCAGGPTSRVTGLAQPVSLTVGDDGFLYWANAGLANLASTTSSIQRIRP